VALFFSAVGILIFQVFQTQEEILEPLSESWVFASYLWSLSVLPGSTVRSIVKKQHHANDYWIAVAQLTRPDRRKSETARSPPKRSLSGAGEKGTMLGTWSAVVEVVPHASVEPSDRVYPCAHEKLQHEKPKEPSDEPIGWNRYGCHCPSSGARCFVAPRYCWRRE
jgi:hypothetical protein